jgi:hypothetical protein
MDLLKHRILSMVPRFELIPVVSISGQERAEIRYA